MSRIAQRFDRAASTYRQATAIQRRVAGTLAGRIDGLGLAPGGRVVEFGCGTGYLPLAAWAGLRPSLWLATDIAPAMAAAAARALPEGGLVAVMDADRPALAGGFDLACSSLTLQWLEHPGETVRRWRNLVRPGGWLAVATLTRGAFEEWRAALSVAGAAHAAHAFPTADEARAWFGAQTRFETFTLVERRRSALAFMRSLRAAGVDSGQGRALDAATMRKAMRAFEAAGVRVSYEVLLALEPV